MRRYFSTFITGLQEVIEQCLTSTFKKIRIETLTDGLVIYEARASAELIKNLPFFNNSFFLLRIYKKLDNKPINQMIKHSLADKNISGDIQKLTHNYRTFRVMFSEENQFVSVDKDLLNKLENKFTNPKFHPDRTNPGVEIFYLYRSEGFGLIGLRLTRHTDYKKTLEKGELRPELSFLLNFISEPSPQDIFLDPFAGSGSIPFSRMRNFKYKQLFIGDINENIVNKLKEKFKNTNDSITVGCWDALDLKTFKDSSIDKIVTDPPWGLFSGRNLNLEKFYTQMLEEFFRALRKNGVLVILLSNKELFEKRLSAFTAKFVVKNKYNILVSGGKAAIYKLEKL